MLVDNGCTSDAVDVAVVGRRASPSSGRGATSASRPGATSAPGAAGGEFVAFVNGDAVVRSDALGKLVVGPADDVGLTTASLRLYDEPDTLNSAGNPVHYLGLSWAGGLGVAASAYERGQAVPRTSPPPPVRRRSARADRFAALGGFCEPMFAYCEDTDLSLRCWQRGWRVVLVPDAVVLHRYEFSRNPQKLFLLERNRLLMVLTVYSGRLLAAVLRPLRGPGAGRCSRWRPRTAGPAARWPAGGGCCGTPAWSGAGGVRSRRRGWSPTRRLVRLLTGDVTPGVDGLSVPTMLRRVSVAYWALARRAVQ